VVVVVVERVMGVAGLVERVSRLCLPSFLPPLLNLSITFSTFFNCWKRLKGS